MKSPQLGRKLAIALFLWSTPIAPATFAVELATLRAAANTITSQELETHVNVLADDSFEGREAGTRGGYAAAGYLAKQLQTRGLAAAGDEGTYFQTFGNGYRNILAILPGSDPVLKKQIVVLAAHYDHVGYGSRGNSFGPWGYVHNGADDNASGTSGLLEVIDAFLALPSPPKRTILFAFFDGEEKGLLGSKHWTASPTLPLNHVEFMVNCDMIGRLQNERVEVYGSRTSPGLRRLLCEGNQLTNLALDFNWEMKENSDHYTFFAQNIPVLMLHTGLHDDYHRPSDDPHLLNVPGMQEVSRLLFAVGHQLADRPENAKFRSEAIEETPSHEESLESPITPAPPRLGVVSKKLDANPPIVEIESVTSGSPADLAGIQPGDRWVRFAGHPVTDLKQFRLEILTAKSPVPVVLERPGETKPIELSIQLAGDPVRFGISWREDVNEPGTVILTQVIYGSPAQLAGLQIRDRLYDVNGVRFQSSAELHKILHAATGTTRVLAERDGKFRTVLIEIATPAAM